MAVGNSLSVGRGHPECKFGGPSTSGGFTKDDQEINGRLKDTDNLEMGGWFLISS